MPRASGDATAHRVLMTVRMGGGAISWLWVLAGVLLAVVLAVGLVAVSGSTDQATTLRAATLGIVGSFFATVIGFGMQTRYSRADRRREVRRAAYLLLIRAAGRLYDLNHEQTMWPNGHPWSGAAAGMNPADAPGAYLQHDPFHVEKALADEVRALQYEARPMLALEEGPDEPALTAWAEVDRAYWQCVAARTKEGRTIEAIQEREHQLASAIDHLSAVCHQRLAQV